MFLNHYLSDDQNNLQDLHIIPTRIKVLLRYLDDYLGDFPGAYPLGQQLGNNVCVPT